MIHCINCNDPLTYRSNCTDPDEQCMLRNCDKLLIVDSEYCDCPSVFCLWDSGDRDLECMRRLYTRTSVIIKREINSPKYHEQMDNMKLYNRLKIWYDSCPDEEEYNDIQSRNRLEDIKNTIDTTLNINTNRMFTTVVHSGNSKSCPKCNQC